MAARAIIGLALATLIYLAPAPPPTQEPIGLGDLGGRLAVMERKARLLTESGAQVMDRYRRDVAPIEMALLRSNRVRDPMMARLAAWAIVRETETRHLSPELVAAVIRVEDPWLVTDTVSYAGAVGWMQIKPLHVYDGHPCGTDLTDGDTNVCYGTTILREYIARALDRALREALLAYNGCVSTPGCEVYADHVLDRVNQ